MQPVQEILSRMNFQTLKVRFQDSICFLQLYRPDADNTINDLLVEELQAAIGLCEERRDEPVTIIVLEGMPEVFCSGADFQVLHREATQESPIRLRPEPLYDFWMKMATGPFITIAHVRGQVNAGGVGFIAASDIVLADRTAQFGLSELLFGLFPACVLPFLIRRIGFQKAHYLTLMTQPIMVEQAHCIGLVDAYDEQSEVLLRKHLLRLRRLSKEAISRYKAYMGIMDDFLQQAKSPALTANREVFSDPVNLKGIARYVEEGKFPWES